ncbi:hypothetical protein DQ04_00671040 [Trypanosoma grayi]|uniref:hypothetical protein n=1 Tax=Trypanosoma grayi TaxID=71804 RepID=UPI0004F44A22|nr:hypothetical protein DQ04_00671040 [Trypanosoma grayi]KEG14001.1 hypothetical protein DQ04_00671040 [Trypanosoma grayi]
MRARDLCTAAFYDDVQRLRQLVRAALPEDEEEEEEEQVAGDEEEEEEEEQIALNNLGRRRRRREAVAALLGGANLLRVVETGEEYGFLFRVEELRNDGRLQPQFKVSRRSRYPAAPLHWAVLGRSHHAVEFLVTRGVDVLQEVPDFPSVTAAAICQCNNSLETARRLEKAVEVHQQRLQNEEEQKQKWLEILDEKKKERERLAALEEQEEAEGSNEEGGSDGDDADAGDDDDGADDDADEENPDDDA